MEYLTVQAFQSVMKVVEDRLSNIEIGIGKVEGHIEGITDQIKTHLITNGQGNKNSNTNGINIKGRGKSISIKKDSVLLVVLLMMGVEMKSGILSKILEKITVWILG